MTLVQRPTLIKSREYRTETVRHIAYVVDERKIVGLEARKTIHF
jgi:hypothetical protein